MKTKMRSFKIILAVTVTVCGVGFLFTNMAAQLPKIGSDAGNAAKYLASSKRLAGQIGNASLSAGVRRMYEVQKRLVDNLLSGAVLAHDCDDLTKQAGKLVPGVYSVYPTGNFIESSQVQCGISSVAAVPASSAPSTQICQSAVDFSKITLSCPTGTAIDTVQFANYGTSTGSCGGSALTPGHCDAGSSVLSAVQSICVGKANCWMTALPQTFNVTDPCYGVQKHLTVQATCTASAIGKTAPALPVPTNVQMCFGASEGGKATLACPSGKVIQSIDFASYGTPGGSCGAFYGGSCNSIQSTSVVSKLCLGKANCSLTPSNATFNGDPCLGVHKGFFAQVTCAPAATTATVAPSGTSAPTQASASNGGGRTVASSGSPTQSSFSNTPAVACPFDGGAVASGTSITAYSTCGKTLSRKCTSGVLAGDDTYRYRSCLIGSVRSNSQSNSSVQTCSCN